MTAQAITYNPGGLQNGCGVAWTGLNNGEVGVPFLTADFADASVQVRGTFGAGGSVSLQGSNIAEPDLAAGSTDWHILTDPQGNVLTFTSARLEHIAEGVRWLRPRVTAGDGTTDLEVHLWLRRNR